MDPKQYCENIITPGSSVYYAIRFSPKAQRQALLAVLAWHKTISHIPFDSAEPQVVQAKLNWWQEQIAGLYAGNAPTHPIAKALAPVIAKHQLKQDLFQTIIEGTAEANQYQRYPSQQEFILNAHKSHGCAGLLLSQLCRPDDPQALRFARDIGAFIKMVKILQNAHALQRQGIFPLIESELEQLEDFEPGKLQQAPPQQQQAILVAYHRLARTLRQSAYAHIENAETVTLKPLLILGKLYSALLNTLENEAFPVFAQHIRLTPMRKLYLAWRG